MTEAERPLWIVRVPKGIATTRALTSGLAPIDVGVKEDIAGHDTLEAMLTEVHHARPDLTPKKAESRAATLLDLATAIRDGDLVLIHGSGDPVSAVCIAGPSRTQEGMPALRFSDARTHHAADFGEDIKNSMRAHITLSRSQAPQASKRIEELRLTGKDSGPQGATDVESIGARMEAHELAHLVADLLRTDGYLCRISPPGPDGGVDIYAGKGLLGLGDSLLVQVKSGRQVVSGPQVHQILGNLFECGASATLIVSWSGFTGDARRIIKNNPFKIISWDFEDILRILDERKQDVADIWQKKFFLPPLGLTHKNK